MIGPDTQIDDAYVIAHLEHAGKTLMALPHSGFSTRLKQPTVNFAMAAAHSSGWFAGSAAKCPRPTPEAISAMDNTLSWMSYIPNDVIVLRRVVGARCLINPITDKHLYSWRKIGDFMSVDHKTAQRWHRDGIGYIVNAINKRKAAA